MIASSGSAIGSGLVTRILDHFGPVLYNLYGSTEVAVATIATPDDLRIDPSTAGRVVIGSRVEILDVDGERGARRRDRAGVRRRARCRSTATPTAATRNASAGCSRPATWAGSATGSLFVEGRDDDMIVSGGENVFPAEVEELLRAHPAIADAAVVGVADDEFGQAPRGVRRHRARRKSSRPTQVRDHVKEQLARHKVPRTVTFIDELPRNATGKLLRRELHAQG